MAKIQTKRRVKVGKGNNPNAYSCGCYRFFGKWVLCPAHEEDLMRVLKIEQEEND